VARYEFREVITRHLEFRVPLGDPAQEIEAALLAAQHAWQESHNDSSCPADYATVTADDECVIIRVKVPYNSR
jgi:hypothetical protein